MGAGATRLGEQVLAGWREEDDLGHGVALHHPRPVEPLKVAAAHHRRIAPRLGLALLELFLGLLHDRRHPRRQAVVDTASLHLHDFIAVVSPPSSMFSFPLLCVFIPLPYVGLSLVVLVSDLKGEK